MQDLTAAMPTASPTIIRKALKTAIFVSTFYLFFLLFPFSVFYNKDISMYDSHKT